MKLFTVLIISFTTVFLSNNNLFTQEPDFFQIVGFATEDGGTTGGTGGDIDTVTTGTELQQLINDKNPSTPLTIFVDSIINLANSTGLSKIDIKDVSDISVIGIGTGAEFNGIGIKIYRASNIIIRNLKVHHVLSGEKDCISIEGPADHIWIDHCELYNELDGVEKDYYDGLLDAKKDAEYITYSWNYLHDSWKAMLVGSSESDIYDRKLTMHHNKFEDINSRLPLFRASTGHFFNNYYVDVVSTAINSRINSCAKIENNYFIDVNNPWVSAYSSVLGGGDTVGNILVNSPFVYSDDTHKLPECSLTVPYEYTNVLNTAAVVPDIDDLFAGVGKLDIGTDPIYLLKTTISGQGSLSIEPEKSYYDSGDVVTITAVPDTDWEFNNWSGSKTGSINPLVITMNENKIINASFITHKMAISYQSSGPGTITADPDLPLYDSNSVVSLTAIPYQNAYFKGWTGDVESTDNPLEITLDSNMTVTGLFVYKPDSSLTIQVEEEYCYLDGSIETEHSGYTGSGFADFNNTSGSKLNLAVNSNKDIYCELSVRYAHGKTDERSVLIFVNGAGTDTIDFAPTGAWTTWLTVNEGINLSKGNNIVSFVSLTENGSANIDKIEFTAADTSLSIGSCSGDTIEIIKTPTGLTATIVSESQVDLNWVDNSDNETSFVVERREGVGPFTVISEEPANTTSYTDSAITLGITYTYRIKATSSMAESAYSNSVEVTPKVLNPGFTLTIFLEPEEGGKYTVIPNQASYDSGSVVTVSVFANDGYEFIKWAGDITGTDESVDITMDDNKAITAYFTDVVSSGMNVPVTDAGFTIFPNPITSTSTINFTVHSTAYVEVNIINTVGIKANVYKNYISGGSIESIKLQQGKYKPGIYFIELIVGDYREIKKVIIRNKRF